MIFQHLETIVFKNNVIVIGRTEDNRSIAVKLNDVLPHITVGYRVGIQEEIIDTFQRYKYFQMSKRYPPKCCSEDIQHHLKFQILKGQDIIQYDEHSESRFLKITTQNIWDFNALKRMLKYTLTVADSLVVDKSYKDVRTYSGRLTKHKYLVKTKETNINCTVYNDQVNTQLQYFIDKDIYTCAWFSVEGVETEASDKLTRCDVEYNGTIHKTDKTGMAPWRILSYDIESLPPPRKNNPSKYDFPKADKRKFVNKINPDASRQYSMEVDAGDPVITICATLTMPEVEYYAWILCPDKAEYTLYDVEDFAASKATVFVFESEMELLEDFIEFIGEKDVDFIQGHNVNRFDNDYVLKRYNALQKEKHTHIVWKEEIKEYVDKKAIKKANWSRLQNHETKINKSTFSSSQKGSIEKFKLDIPGRVVLDSYDIMKDQHNESSYKLDNLAQKYLGTKKVPMDYDQIYPKFQSHEGRTELAVYCLKDAYLVHKLMEKLCKLNVILQMANVCGISMKDVIERGQGIRTICLMIRYAKKHRYFIPRVEPSKEDKSFEGAVVVDPTAGYYTDAVSCLDFASLYPSIMQCMNMSYETLVDRKTIEKMGWKEDEDVRTIPDYSFDNGKFKSTFNPNNPAFVTAKTRIGLLPEMLETLLAERKKVKKMMKAEKAHSTMYNVYNGRQLGLKVVCNSIYGFTGASVGFLPCKTIASSVTKYGRGLTLKTKDMIENHPVWGKEHKCKCIYGDTDSVFVHMPRSLVDGKDREELVNNAHKMGEIMANYITKQFLSPVLLEYEKTYCPYLLLKKKRYAGYKFEPGLPPKLHLKGIEAVRRDFAPLLVDTQKRLLNALIIEQDKKQACQIVHQVVKDLFADKIPLDMFVMSKKLSRDPSEYASKGPHVLLALRMAKKNPMTAPVAGDRVEYVIHVGHKMLSERACIPKDIKNGTYLVDFTYYFTKQLKTPLLRILKNVVGDPEQYFKVSRIRKRAPTGNNPFAGWLKIPRIS